MEKGSNASIQICSGAFVNANPSDVGINYVAADFTTFETIIITNNSWNNVGTFISGFDFTRADGRDAKAFIISNAGMGDQNPKCKINVRNNSTLTAIANSGTWYKANWTNTSEITCKWTVSNNKIIYQPTNKRNVLITITGNLSVNNSNRTISIGFVKNGVTTTRYGECDLRVTSANQPFQFSTVVYIENVSENDYFELFCTSNTSSDNVVFQDIQWFTDTK